MAGSPRCGEPSKPRCRKRPCSTSFSVTPRAPPPVDVLVPLGAQVGPALLDACRPRLVQQFGVGLQGVDLEAARRRNIAVANVPAADTGNAAAVAELAMLHLLALLRHWGQAAQAAVEQRRVGSPMGAMLASRTVAVLGVGAIGTHVITRLRAFEAEPVGVGRRDLDAVPNVAALLDAQHYHQVDDLAVALRRSDALLVCCPLTEHTRGLVGAGALNALPAGGFLVNVGRGPVVDRDALLAALRSGHLAGAGLDVAWTEPIDPDDELLAHNVTVTPHIGGVTQESYAAMASAFAANIGHHANGELYAYRTV